MIKRVSCICRAYARAMKLLEVEVQRQIVEACSESVPAFDVNMFESGSMYFAIGSAWDGLKSLIKQKSRKPTMMIVRSLCLEPLRLPGITDGEEERKEDLR